MSASVKIESRTAKSLKNSIIALGFYLVNLVLQFFSRKIFLEYLGTEILGLNTTASNLLQFLNLAELGISSAVGFTLYKPLYEKDYDTVNEIVTLQGHLYKRIGIGIIIGAIVLMCFFPLIFEKIELPLWYAYASFGVLFYSALLGYFVNYHQIVLSANQQDYKILYYFKSVIFIKLIFQIVAMRFWEYPYVWWLVLEAFFALLASLSLKKGTDLNFPFLKKSKATYGSLKEKYHVVTVKIKQLFFHKIGSFALSQTAPIIIYAFTSLTTVALYGNYLIVITGAQVLLISLFTSMNASVGNLVAETRDEKIDTVFMEIFSFRLLLSSSVCVIAFLLIPEFIILWIGESYLLPSSTLLLMITALYINTSRMTVDSYINAAGLFQDIYSPLIETIINIGFSIWLGSIWGLNGVLSGSLISLFIIAFCWKPYFLFSQFMGKGVFWYVWLYCRNLFPVIIATGITFFMSSFLNWQLSWFIFFCKAVLLSVIYILSCSFLQILCHSGLQLFIQRLRILCRI